MQLANDFGCRSGRTEALRWAGLVLLLVATLILELSLGRHYENVHVEGLQKAAENQAMAHYQAPAGRLAIPAKAAGTQRVVYISNSHAMTGGRVSAHLQELLDRVQPGGFEVLDLSSPGIFAPDMLQRALAAMDMQPDLLVLAVAYISFSDRMPLSLQAHSARSFFKPGVFSRLSLGFWWRNYDIGLMGETLFAKHARIFRYRDRVRDLWEQPLLEAIRPDDGGAVLFLDVDEDQRWRFPEGYDANLFQWRLYAAGRDGHLGDLHELIRACAKEGLPVLACNLPVDFRKSLFDADLNDFERFREELAEILGEVEEYVDYQACFPVGFTAYDAMHPTWHGARLHALDIALRLQKRGHLVAAPEVLMAELEAMDRDGSEAYIDRIAEPAPHEPGGGIRRFELGEPANAGELLARVAATEVGGDTEMHLLYSLALRILFWGGDLQGEAGCSEGFTPGWHEAVRHEIASARERTELFAHALAALQDRRLGDFPLPESATYVSSAHIGTVEIAGRAVQITRFALADGSSGVELVAPDGRIVAYEVAAHDGRPGYYRVDLLGDGSFILARPLDLGFEPPSWLYEGDPMIRWGW